MALVASAPTFQRHCCANSAEFSFPRLHSTTYHCERRLSAPSLTASFLRAPRTIRATEATAAAEGDDGTVASSLVDAGTNNVDALREDSTVAKSVSLLKEAAQTKKVPPKDVLGALCALQQARLDPSSFLHIIGGIQSPGRTWMLVFNSSKQMVSDYQKGGSGGGSYFPVTAVQRFDAAAMRIENGIFLGPVGFLTFEGRFSWKKNILAFIFETINIKIGSLNSFKFNIAKKEDEGRAPSSKDPFFIWLYADEEIIAAKGRGGGLAFWCRCKRV